eukprot:scaffold31781_cov152-Isochrysis_galbana.AAC.3
MRDSSTEDSPEVTKPSTGTRAPGLSSSSSPSCTCSIGFSTPPTVTTLDGSSPPSAPACVEVWCTHHF